MSWGTVGVLVSRVGGVSGTSGRIVVGVLRGVWVWGTGVRGGRYGRSVPPSTSSGHPKPSVEVKPFLPTTPSSSVFTGPLSCAVSTSCLTHLSYTFVRY